MSDFDPKEFFDEKAKRFKDDPELAACGFNHVSNQCMTRVQKKALQAAIRNIGGRKTFSGKSLLDLGCGSGRWANLFAELSSSYCGVDISDEMISMCQSFHPSLLFAAMDGKRIPTDSEMFDFVFVVAVLHHNRRAEQDILLREISRVIKPGGYLFLFEAIGSTPGKRVFPRTLKDWTESISSLGYECVLRRGYHYFPLLALFNFFARRIFPAHVSHWRILKLEAALSPAFSRMLPNQLVRGGRGLMLFRRTTQA